MCVFKHTVGYKQLRPCCDRGIDVWTDTDDSSLYVNVSAAFIFGCGLLHDSVWTGWTHVSNSLYMKVFTPSRSSAILTSSWSERTWTEGSWRIRLRVQKVDVRSWWSPVQQCVRGPRDREWGPWQSAGWSVWHVKRRGLPPAASSTYFSGSGTRSWPESPSGGGTLPAPPSPSCSGTASRQRWTPAETPDCGWTRCGSSSSGWSSGLALTARQSRCACPRCRLSGCCPLSSCRSRRCPQLSVRILPGSPCHWSIWSYSGHLDLYYLLDLNGEKNMSDLQSKLKESALKRLPYFSVESWRNNSFHWNTNKNVSAEG